MLDDGAVARGDSRDGRVRQMESSESAASGYKCCESGGDVTLLECFLVGCVVGLRDHDLHRGDTNRDDEGLLDGEGLGRTSSE